MASSGGVVGGGGGPSFGAGGTGGRRPGLLGTLLGGSGLLGRRPGLGGLGGGGLGGRLPGGLGGGQLSGLLGGLGGGGNGQNGGAGLLILLTLLMGLFSGMNNGGQNAAIESQKEIVARAPIEENRTIDQEVKKESQDMKNPPTEVIQAREEVKKLLIDKKPDPLFGGNPAAEKVREEDVNKLFNDPQLLAMMKYCTAPTVVDLDPEVYAAHIAANGRSAMGPEGRICCVEEGTEGLPYDLVLSRQKQYLVDSFVPVARLDVYPMDHARAYTPQEVNKFKAERTSVVLSMSGDSAEETFDAVRKVAQKIGAEAPQTQVNANEISALGLEFTDHLMEVDRRLVGNAGLAAGVRQSAASISPEPFMTSKEFKERLSMELWREAGLHKAQFQKTPEIKRTSDVIKSFMGQQHQYRMRPSLLMGLKAKTGWFSLAEAYQEWKGDPTIGYRASASRRQGGSGVIGSGRTPEEISKLYGHGGGNVLYNPGSQFPHLAAMMNFAPHDSQNDFWESFRISAIAYGENQKSFYPGALSDPSWKKLGLPVRGLSPDGYKYGIGHVGMRLMSVAGSKNNALACFGGNNKSLDSKEKTPFRMGEGFGSKSNYIETGAKGGAMYVQFQPARMCPKGYVIHPQSGCGILKLKENISQDERPLS